MHVSCCSLHWSPIATDKNHRSLDECRVMIPHSELLLLLLLHIINSTAQWMYFKLREREKKNTLFGGFD